MPRHKLHSLFHVIQAIL